MPPKQNENFREMVGHILSVFPSYPPHMARTRINHHLRSIIARRPWSGLCKYQVLDVPAPYSTGTVSITNGSNVVTGVSTAWSFNDVVNTTISEAVLETGTQEIGLTSMTNVAEGQWMLIDGGESNEEAVQILRTDTVNSRIRANFTKTHDASETAYVGTYNGRQLRVSENYPILTVIGMSSATRALLSQNWTGSSVSAQTYSIGMIYTDLGVRDCKELLTIVNLSQRWQIATHFPREVLDHSDPHRSVSNQTYMIVPVDVDDGGVQRYELYPRPTSAASFPFVYVKQWEELSKDYDELPNGVRSDVVVDRVMADAYRFPKHKVIDGGIYYDPAIARDLYRQTEIEIQHMATDDDNTRIMSMYYNYKQWPFGGFGSSWNQSHDWDGFVGRV